MEEQIEKLQKELEQLKKEKEEYLAGWQRARADLLNYKREEEERRGAWMRSAKEVLLFKLISLLDNFEIAEKNVSEELKANEVVKGLLLLRIQLQDFLRGYGVEAIQVIGEKFDPLLHEAVGEVEKEGAESGTIGEEIQKGYAINGNLIRPTKVKLVK